MIDNNININGSNLINDKKLHQNKVKTEPILPFDSAEQLKITNDQNQNLSNYNFESIFERFISSLESYPIMSEGAKKLFNKQFINFNIKNDPVLATLFEAFLDSIKMTEPEILDFLKFQQKTYTKFQGEFFDNLRTIYQSNSSNKDFQKIIRSFLRSYDCFVSADETNQSINNALSNIEKNLPTMLKEPFTEMTEKLISNSSKGYDLNLNTLKTEILPFMGRYISKMNDFGPVRDYVSVLVHNLVRLESASKENFAESFDSLLDFINYNLNVDEEQLESLRMSLISTYEASSNIRNNTLDSFLNLLQCGVKKSNNYLNQGLMQDMADSLLFNHNVHIPLTHMFLPLNFNGLYMFAELWIGIENEKGLDRKKKQKSSKTYTIFTTFDIQSIGYFETTIVYYDSKMLLDVYLPGNLISQEEKIINDLTKIIKNNNLNVASISLHEATKKRKFSEVFTNLAERKNSIDVTI